MTPANNVGAYPPPFTGAKPRQDAPEAAVVQRCRCEGGPNLQRDEEGELRCIKCGKPI